MFGIRTTKPATQPSLPSMSPSVAAELEAMERALADLRTQARADDRAALYPSAEVQSHERRPRELTDKDVQKFIVDYVDKMSRKLREISLQLYEHPELAFEEHRAHRLLTKSLAALGFQISAVDDLPTAFVAEYTQGQGGRTHGFCCEYDALKGVGQACGHNLIAICGLGAGAAVKAAMEHFDIAGTVKVIGTPAEEGGGGKVLTIQKGIFKSLDTCSMAHPSGDGGVVEEGYAGSCTIGGPGSLARSAITAEFFGRGAHAGAKPWAGINALDAAVASYNNISMLRQQLEPDTRVHGLILGNEDWNPNVIPNYAKLDYNIRAPTIGNLNELEHKVVACMKAGAEATGCTVKFTVPESGKYAELRNNEPLALAWRDTMHQVYDQKIEMKTKTTASTDFGNVTLELPSIHPGFSIPTVPGGGNHTKEFTKAASTQEAHELSIKVVVGLALVTVKVMTDDKFFKDVKDAFKAKQ